LQKKQSQQVDTVAKKNRQTSRHSVSQLRIENIRVSRVPI